jgi:hypothetical protein
MLSKGKNEMIKSDKEKKERKKWKGKHKKKENHRNILMISS